MVYNKDKVKGGENVITLETIKEVAILMASILGSIYLRYQIKEKKIEIEIKKLQLQNLKEDGGK